MYMPRIPHSVNCPRSIVCGPPPACTIHRAAMALKIYRPSALPKGVLHLCKIYRPSYNAICIALARWDVYQCNMASLYSGGCVHVKMSGQKKRERRSTLADY